MKQRKHNNKLDFMSQSYYDNFGEFHPNIELTQLMHTKIIKTFFSIVIKKIIHDMYKFHFPGLGYFYLTKNKTIIKEDENGNLKINASINWRETMKLRKITGDNTKKVLYLNDHTNGYVYGFYWDKKRAAFTNKMFYSFIPCQAVQRYLARTIFENIKPLNAYAR